MRMAMKSSAPPNPSSSPQSSGYVSSELVNAWNASTMPEPSMADHSGSYSGRL